MANKPSHVIVVHNERGYAYRVGVAWPTKNGDGFTLQIQEGISVSCMNGARVSVVPERERTSRDDQERERTSRDDRDERPPSHGERRG